MASPSQSNGVTTGPLTPQDNYGDYNALLFIFGQLAAGMQTATLVRVDACTNSGGLTPVGTVDVTPLVNMVDGQGNPTPHVTVYGLPYQRIQGGTSGFIIDPEVGDIGVAVFANRDISRVKATKAQANPGSNREFSFADGMYLGGMLNGVPTQYVRFTSDGVEIVSPQTVTIRGASIVLDGPVTQSGGDVTIAENLTANGDVMAQTVSLHNHLHTSAAPGNPTSPPIP